MLFPNFIEVHGFANKCEWVVSWLRGLLFVAALCVVCGCASDGVSIVFSGSTNTDIANLTIQESTKIPVIAYRSGPYLWAHTRKDFAGAVYFEGKCDVTNRTTALWGMYESGERKVMDFGGVIAPCATNAVEGVK